ncbi:transcription factor 19 isoform X7 [Equus caballus]|uniref:transcription factor 19 isoform X7 n=1 Tax=Equus caballus TaxID=9796 RepID=UPI0038B3FD80
MERRRANDLANQEWHGGGLPRREVRAREFRRRGRRCPRAEAAPLLASASSLSNSRWSAGSGRSPRGPGAAERLALPGEEITPRLHRAEPGLISGVHAELHAERWGDDWRVSLEDHSSQGIGGNQLTECWQNWMMRERLPRAPHQSLWSPGRNSVLRKPHLHPAEIDVGVLGSTQRE